MSGICVVRPSHAMGWLVWILATLGSALFTGQAGSQSILPPGFVYLRDVDPTIAQDIRYAGSNNFVGRPLPGYDAAECILRRDVAAALKSVQADLASSGFALKVYDCYRPERAVRAMWRWANDGDDGGATKHFFPRLQKNTLFALGYIAARSAHSTGAAVDLTLIELARAPAGAFAAAAGNGPCAGPAASRVPDNGVDMGTGFDCFDTNSHTSSSAVGAEARRWRGVLVAVMARHGFKNYYREWWHFSYPDRAPDAYYDFPIRPRSTKAPLQN